MHITSAMSKLERWKNERVKKIIVNGRNVKIKAISDYGEGKIEKLIFGWKGYLDKAVIKYPQFKDAHPFKSDKFDLVIEAEDE